MQRFIYKNLYSFLEKGFSSVFQRQHTQNSLIQTIHTAAVMLNNSQVVALKFTVCPDFQIFTCARAKLMTGSAALKPLEDMKMRVDKRLKQLVVLTEHCLALTSPQHSKFKFRPSTQSKLTKTRNKNTRIFFSPSGKCTDILTVVQSDVKRWYHTAVSRSTKGVWASGRKLSVSSCHASSSCANAKPLFSLCCTGCLCCAESCRNNEKVNT